ncbi:MAG: NADP-dependent malic enzyme [Clostridiales Family XIII bacterium]|jgi:malate dehydrogenase (oxaloacetate-decarboxylating)|nr:NADP-dependent malic enzyme [Clostridiales Family XIII bacterium]
MDYYNESVKMHRSHRGKLEISSKVPIRTTDDLSTAYTPGVAKPCIEIQKNPDEAYELTIKANTVAVVSDGSAVLGLGNIGGLAALPVMEGKAVLFKEFGDVDAFPICLSTQDPDEIVETVIRIAPTFGGINLEDISAPRCFEIERRIQEALDIPVFHDDQHGTAIVVSAAVINAYRLLKRRLKSIKAVVNGAGAAGAAIVKMLSALGLADIVICDSKGIISMDRFSELAEDKLNLLGITNKDNLSGGLAEAAVGRDLFIGVSAPKALTEEMIKTMAPDAVIFAMANPEPEIMPATAKDAGAKIVGTGRSDFPNQINNVLAFPGIFKGALKARASRITEEMKIAAAYALANLVKADELSENCVIPSAFHPNVAETVANAVADAWRASESAPCDTGIAEKSQSRDESGDEARSATDGSTNESDG